MDLKLKQFYDLEGNTECKFDELAQLMGDVWQGAIEYGIKYTNINESQKALIKLICDDLAKLMQKKDWKADFGIMMSEDEDDFWSSLCIFNMCYTGTEAVCSSGCCSECCALIGIAACFSICCKGDIDHAEPCLAECLVDYFKCLCWCCSC